MDAKKLITDLQSAIHKNSKCVPGSVAAHVYTEGFLLAVVAELCRSDSANWVYLNRKIRAAAKKS